MPAQGQKSKVPVNAPLNPQYLKEIRDPDTDLSQGVKNLPWSPVFSSLSPSRPSATRNTLPEAYDMRTAGPGGTSLLTPVKNQGGCGSCWAFSSLGSVESTWKLKGYGDYDLSENNIKNCHGFLAAPCGYGSNFHPTAMFARGEGPMYEADDPYSTTNGTCVTGLTPAALVTQVLYVPPSVEAIKETIYKHGGISMPMRIAGSYYMDPGNYTYFNNLTTSTNHLISLVGWDDNMKVTGGTISGRPPAGVFIAKNSYGTTWGDNGFFYISYYDLHIIDYGVCWPEREDFTPGTEVYTHSRLGSFYSTGYVDPVGYGLVKLSLDENAQLVRLGTFVNAAMAEVSFEVYDDFDDVNLILSNKITEVDHQYCDWPGYYTFELPESVSFNTANDIYVKVRYYTPGVDEPIPIEKFMSGFCDPAIASNSCWISGDGQDGNWFLVGGTTSYLYDLCIYAYTESLTSWTGAVDNSWANASNWDNGVPDSSMHARIPNTLTMPNISGSERCRSLHIGSAMTLTIASGGSLDIDKELVVEGSLNKVGSLNIDPAASIIYRSSSAQQIDGSISSAGHLIIDNPSGVTLNSSIQVQDRLCLKAGSITAGIYSISYAEGAELHYQGSSAQTCSSAEFPSTSGPDILRIDNASGVSLHASRTLDSTLFLVSGTLNNSSNNITLSNEQKIVRYAGSLTTAPVFPANIDLDYRSPVSISTSYELPSSTSVLRDLSVNCPQTLSLNSSATINGILNLNIGSFDNSSSTLSLADGVIMNIRTGSLAAAPSFGTTLDLNYLGDIHYESGYEIPSSSTVVQDLRMENTGGVDLNSNLMVNSSLTMVSGVFDNSSSTLSLANNATIVMDPGLLDGAYSSMPSLAAKPSFGANVNLEYYGRWWMVMGHEMPDAADQKLNHLTMDTYASLYPGKDLYAKGNVSARGNLRMEGYTISGPGNLDILRQAVVHTEHAFGINNSSGSFQLGGTSNYNDTIDFYFEGSSAQFMGLNIPPKMRRLIINNSSGVTLQSKNIRVMGDLSVEAGSIFNITNGRTVEVD